VNVTLDEAKAALISVLKDIQARSGLPCPDLSGTDVPPDVLEKFDSTVWPAATTLVARKLGVTIPNNVHIFGGEKGTTLLNIDQASELILQRHELKAQLQGAA
jgi:hypothetical protein